MNETNAKAGTKADAKIGTKRVRYTADVRRRLIVDAAFAAIAQQGFENLRTRDIADQVGINSATLHHHFPTKDDLIAAVAEALETRFVSEKTRVVDTKPANAATLLDCQFADAAFYRDERPDWLAVYREFVARSPRDPQIAALVARLNDGWRLDIVGILERGMVDGSFRADLDPSAMSDVILNAIWGAVMARTISPHAYEQMCGEILKMVSPPKNSARQ